MMRCASGAMQTDSHPEILSSTNRAKEQVHRSFALLRMKFFLVAVTLKLCDNYVMRSTPRVVDKESPPGHYSDPPMLVLASLSDGPKHGHAMIEDITRLCGTRLGPGTLYGAISRLEQQGWIAPLPPEERRRPYRITAEGARILRAKLTTLRQFAKAGLRRLEAL
jgi:DNA-binding PadR family transcriptional regulator